MRTPDFTRFARVLTRGGEPDYVPLGDVGVHGLHKARLIGRKITSMADEVEFWTKAGFDYVPHGQGLQQTELITRQSMTAHDAHYAADESAATQTRSWAAEGKGIIGSKADLDSVEWPDPDALDYSGFAELDRLLPDNLKVMAGLGKVFTSGSWLMGLVGLSEALADDPELVAEVYRRVGAFQYRVLENMLDFRSVGAVWHADDIAYSGGLLVSPAVLHAHIFPWYEKMNRLTHERGRLCVYHSDGKLDRALDDIVRVGFDGLNPIEPKVMDIVAVKRRYGDQLAILGNIDLGYTLTRGTPEEVRQEVFERIVALAPGGGYAVASSNSIPEYVPYENFTALREATFEFGKYPIAARL